MAHQKPIPITHFRIASLSSQKGSNHSSKGIVELIVFDHDLAIEKTDIVLKILTRKQERDEDWQDRLDAAFLEAAFDHDLAQPFFIGADGLRYFGFKLPSGEVQPVRPIDLLDQMVEWGAGAVVLDEDGSPAWVYSPGDVVAFSLYQKTVVRWTGGWAEPPDTDCYLKWGRFLICTPGEQMVPALAARCADFYLSEWMKSQPNMESRQPGICTVRNDSHTGREQATDLVLNIFREDAVGNEMLEYASQFFPRHIARRLIVGADKNVRGLSFTPLRDFWEKAGLKPIPPL